MTKVEEKLDSLKFLWGTLKQSYEFIRIDFGFFFFKQAHVELVEILT